MRIHSYPVDQQQPRNSSVHPRGAQITKTLCELDLDRDTLPVDRALGLQWCIETDRFKFKLKIKEKPSTKQGMLSMISSIYDPLGFLAPLILL